MTLDPRRRRVHDQLAALPGVRAIRRPVVPGGGEFDLHYVRTGPAGGCPLVIIPGGPGMASIGPYRNLRRSTAAAGLDVIMVEHRGVGLSRHDDAGADLPAAALTIEQAVDDIAAVLDDAGVEDAIVYGASYGSYLAAGMGVRHPSRVRAMVLDSPVLNRHDIEIVRTALRGLLWDGGSPLAVKVRELAERGRMGPLGAELAATLYELGGVDLLDRQLDLLLSGRRMLWSAVAGVVRRAGHRSVPFHSEADLVGPIGFRELDFAGSPDGRPLDPALAMRRHPGGDTPFDAEPFDLVAALPSFHWPTVVVSGGRDLTTPTAVAERIAALVPRPALVELPTAGHSILDTRREAALRIAAQTCQGRAGELPTLGAELDALPAAPLIRLAGAAVAVAARCEAALPGWVARVTS